jgi:hypothetical protein
MGKRKGDLPPSRERRKDRIRRLNKATLIEMVFAEEKRTHFWFEENKHHKDALKQMRRELDRAQHDLHVYGVQGDYIGMSERLAHTETALRGARADVKILEEALADKKAGNPNWENVAVMKMRKARY